VLNAVPVSIQIDGAAGGLGSGIGSLDGNGIGLTFGAEATRGRQEENHQNGFHHGKGTPERGLSFKPIFQLSPIEPFPDCVFRYLRGRGYRKAFPEGVHFQGSYVDRYGAPLIVDVRDRPFSAEGAVPHIVTPIDRSLGDFEGRFYGIAGGHGGGPTPGSEACAFSDDPFPQGRDLKSNDPQPARFYEI